MGFASDTCAELFAVIGLYAPTTTEEFGAWSRGCVRSVGGGGDVGGGGGAVPASGQNNIPTQNDCQRFADIVDQLGRLWDHDPTRFRDALWDRFNNRSRSGFDYNEFHSSGFKEEFRDEVSPGNSPNQVYHYVGAFRAGFALGYRLGLAVMNDHEKRIDSRNLIRMPAEGVYVPRSLPVTPSHAADMRLNKVAARHGAAVRTRQIRPSELAGLIRREVCR